MSYAEYISHLLICTPAELNGQEKASILKLMEPSNKNEGINSYLWFKRQLPFRPEDEKLVPSLIDRKLIEVIHGSRFRRGGRNYALTTCGLFYILSENQVFSGIFISKYSENIILQLLLFQYLEESTVKNWSPHAEIIISEYLHRCCVTSKRTIETIRSSKISKDKERHLKILELDLKAFAFCLGIKLTRLYSRYRGISNGKNLKHTDRLSHEEVNMLSLLVEDVKFSRFRNSIIKEFNEAFEELVRLKLE
jgi:hypothetical protein